jgi:hypothetical protein
VGASVGVCITVWEKGSGFPFALVALKATTADPCKASSEPNQPFDETCLWQPFINDDTGVSYWASWFCVLVWLFGFSFFCAVENVHGVVAALPSISENVFKIVLVVKKKNCTPVSFERLNHSPYFFHHSLRLSLLFHSIWFSSPFGSVCADQF